MSGCLQENINSYQTTYVGSRREGENRGRNIKGKQEREGHGNGDCKPLCLAMSGFGFSRKFSEQMQKEKPYQLYNRVPPPHQCSKEALFLVLKLKISLKGPQKETIM